MLHTVAQGVREQDLGLTFHSLGDGVGVGSRTCCSGSCGRLAPGRELKVVGVATQVPFAYTVH